MAAVQRELNVAAAAVRSQGSMGVDPEVLMARDHNGDSLLQNLAAVVEGRSKVLVEMSRLVILESQYRAGGGFNIDEARSSLEASFANDAEIVFTTVSSSGRKGLIWWSLMRSYKSNNLDWVSSSSFRIQS
ncbi:hypothetical protein AMTR_s00065p00199360 [Amborella trichopoda]|uniref:Uncharacterized protein n=1 Tax=Amborella trichopoda TaxID=13333 RepID=U5D8Y6_AMBTC|nr:hypothetical protein AMTR_s00065p00199360 [Amborella trichopoda]